MKKMISIIIPIYNVTDFLQKSLLSVKNQSYSNLEIIMVNDGSTDDSGELAQGFVDIDDRFQLIHQENAGLSAARNTGLRKAKGDFVFYLDSDDYLKKDCLEKLIYAQEKYDADIVQANFYYDYPNHLLFNNKLKGATISINQQTAIEGIIAQQEIKNFAWGKLIKRTIAQKHEFPEGRFFEDTLWKYLVIKEINTYVLIGEPLLFYLQRGASISGNFSMRNLDQLYLLDKRLEFLKKCSKKDFGSARLAFEKTLKQHVMLLSELNPEDKKKYIIIVINYIDKYNLNINTIFIKKTILQKWNKWTNRFKSKFYDENKWIKVRKF